MKLKAIILFLLITTPMFAQLERKLVDEGQNAELIFHAPRHINLLTVEPLDKHTLHFAIMHTFGTLDGGIRNLYGIDNGANIQFSFEYAMSDKFSLGASRSSLDKFYNIYGRYHLISQTKDNQVPVSISLMGAAGITTADYSFIVGGNPDFAERTSYAAQMMIARKFSERLSIQISPMFAYFIDPREVYAIQTREDFYMALGVSTKFEITGKSSITLQYIPNLNSERRSNLGIGIDVEAGGHVFQMYFVTSQALNEQYLLAGNNGIPAEGFRIGFNVNRIFATK